jgi:probable phosphoglycerate mutase
VILLARHGETDDNVPPVRVMGQGRDMPLNDTGRAQAVELAEGVADRGFAALWCSGLQRALETAEIVGARVGLEPRVDPRLAETDRGDWEGRTWEEIEAADPAAFRTWRRRPSRFRFPGGESLAEQMDRVVAALVDVTQAGDLPALVVCHGGSIRVALCHTDSRGLEAFHDWDVPNGALIAL